MAGNTSPIFSKVGDIQWKVFTTGTGGTSDYTGTAASATAVFTAGANGAFIQKLRFKAAGTNTASVARVFINNGSTNGTATNNTFFGEVSLPSTAAINTSATVDVDYPMNIALPASYVIYVTLGTTVAGGWAASVVGGEY